MPTDRDPCPQRAPDLTHVVGLDGRCEVCGARVTRADESMAEPRPYRPLRRRLPLPPHIARERDQLMREGFSRSDAEQLICLRRGLGPPANEDPYPQSSVEQRQRRAHNGGASPWKWHDLAALEGVRWRAERMAPEHPDPVERRERPKGRCNRCVGTPDHPAH